MEGVSFSYQRIPDRSGSSQEFNPIFSKVRRLAWQAFGLGNSCLISSLFGVALGKVFSVKHGFMGAGQASIISGLLWTIVSSEGCGEVFISYAHAIKEPTLGKTRQKICILAAAIFQMLFSISLTTSGGFLTAHGMATNEPVNPSSVAMMTGLFGAISLLVSGLSALCGIAMERSRYRNLSRPETAS